LDPRFPPVTVEVNGTEEPMAVLTRALGVLEQALAARGRGRRLGVYDPESGQFTDLVI